MPQGRPVTVPDDGLTTRQRRLQPVLAVHTGVGKGKSTAAFGLALRAWNQGWEQVKRDLAAQTYRLYVLDEFTYPMKWGWVDVDEVVDVLGARPGSQHVVVTGRDAHPRLVDAADLVTEMGKVKHPMDRGQKGQRGIEW